MIIISPKVKPEWAHTPLMKYKDAGKNWKEELCYILPNEVRRNLYKC